MINLPSNPHFSELKAYANFETNVPTLEEMMLKGEEKDSWISVCENVGQLFATIRKKLNATDGEEKRLFPNESIGQRSALGEWILKNNNSWDESIKTIAPSSRLQYLDLDRIRKRGKQAAELMENPNRVTLENLVTRNVQSDNGKVQINFNATQLVHGPLGSDMAVFLADILVKYHQQLKLEHTIRYVTSDCTRSFGRAFDNEINLNETDSKQFWAQTSLLTGWEIIRRVSEDQALREWSDRNEVDLVDIFESGLRLVYNERIDNIGFMTVVALAEI